MNKLRFDLLALAILTGCSAPKIPNIPNSSKDAPSHSQNSSTDTTLQVTVTSTIDTYSCDSVLYIDLINKFVDNGTFYIDLYFLKSPSSKDFENLETVGDTVIYKDDETTRTRIPTEQAEKYFNLTGLSEINIFNKDGEIIASGKFSHVEYYDAPIEGRFVAVFEVNNPNVVDFQYCLSESIKDFTPTKYRKILNQDLKSTLIKYLNLNHDDYMITNHYQLVDSDIAYSTISSDTTAYIIETFGNTINVLYKSKTSETIMDIAFVPKKINDRPILITNSGLPESDMFWTSLLVFNGKEYERLPGHRIKKE